MKSHTIRLGLLSSVLFAFIPIASATTGCNAVGWDEPHGLTGCRLYYPAVHWLYSEGIASGDADTGLFHPDRTINRAEFTKLVLLASGVKNPPACTANPFPDVPKDAWFAPYICEAKKRGIISGFPDGLFKPALDINFANASKILVNSFDVDTNPADANFDSQQSIWFRVYTMALLKKGAVAESIGNFAQLVKRGEMAEMIYRLSTGRSSFDSDQTAEGEQMGQGVVIYDIEEEYGVSLQYPDPPFIYTKSTAFLDKNRVVEGHAFSHVLQQERCGASGMFEHCSATYTDWSIGFYNGSFTESDIASKEIWNEERTTLYFGGRAASCVRLGIEGENTDYCLLKLPNGKTLLVTFDWIDTKFVLDPMLTPVETQKAYFARIRKTMTFME